MLVGIDDDSDGTMGVIDGHATWSVSQLGGPGFFPVPVPILTPVYSANGIYNNANTSKTYVYTAASAGMCETWDYLVKIAENFPIKALYGITYSNSNTLTSFFWLLAGQSQVGPPPGPNTTPGWNGSFALLP